MSVVLSSVDGEGIATFTLNRPERFNALSEEVFSQGLATLRELAARKDVRGLIITGAGKAFCAGADLHDFKKYFDQVGPKGDMGRPVSDSMLHSTNPFTLAIAEFPRPVVCAINGIAAGGGAGLALAGDIILSGRSGSIKVVQVNQLGIIGDLGVNWTIPRMAGRAAAMGALILGETLDAERALRMGLVWEVVDDAKLMERAHALALQMARAPVDAVLATRKLVDASTRVGFAELLEMERTYQRDLTSSPAFIGRVESFFAGKRK